MADIQSNANIAQDLPFDILQEIFELCLPSTDNPELNCQPNSSLVPLLLCHICVSWRTAALGISSIWKSTTFTLYTVCRPDPPFDRLILPKTTQFIVWWKQYISDVAPSLYLPSPSLRIRHLRIRVDRLETANTTLFDGPFFRAAQRLRLAITNQELDIICSKPAPFTNLVELRMENLPYSGIPRLTFSPFPFSPRLTHLQLSHTETFEGRPLSIFPWSQLTHLYLPRTKSANSWRTLLQRCTNLEIMAVILSDPDADTSDSPIVIDSLRQLVVAFNNMHTTVPFNGLLFSQLTAFRLINRLTSTHFITIDALEEVLSAMPALVELHLDWAFSFSDEDFIPFDQVDLRHRGLSSYVPRLKYLVVDFIDPSTRNVGKNIIRFLKSDWLCSGWTSHDSSGLRVRRKLEFIVQNSSYFEDQPIPEEIVAEVKAYLDDNWPAHAPFDVSIQDEESLKGFGRHIFDVFDEKLPSRGWNEAVDFYTSLH